MASTYVIKEHSTGRPVPRATAPLARGEVVQIIMLAKAAFDFQTALGLAEVPPGLSQGDAATAWRHEQQAKAFNLASLNDATQEQRFTLLGYFALLAGKDGEAARYVSRAGAGPAQRRLAEQHLIKVCDRYGFAYPEYPEAILRKPIAEAHAGQLWAVSYTCTNNARRKAARATEEAARRMLS